jgi:hypothetical protein
MRNKKKTKGGAAPLRTASTNRSYTPWFTDGEIQTVMRDATRPHYDPARRLSAIFNTNSKKGIVGMMDFIKKRLDSITSSRGQPQRTTSLSLDEMRNSSTHPPLPGPCSVGQTSTGELIRTRAPNGTPRSCPEGYIAENPQEFEDLDNPQSVKPKRFYSHTSDPFTLAPPPAVFGGASRKNKSRSPSRTMARRSSRRSTRRSSTRKAGRKGSRKTRRSRR